MIKVSLVEPEPQPLTYTIAGLTDAEFNVLQLAVNHYRNSAIASVTDSKVAERIFRAFQVVL